MLGLLLMLEVRDRMTDAHLEALCNIYYNFIMYSGNYYDELASVGSGQSAARPERVRVAT
jgi:hypothetical protein